LQDAVFLTYPEKNEKTAKIKYRVVKAVEVIGNIDSIVTILKQIVYSNSEIRICCRRSKSHEAGEIKLNNISSTRKLNVL